MTSNLGGRIEKLERQAPKQVPLYGIWRKYAGETKQEALAQVAARVPGGNLMGRQVFLLVWGGSDEQEAA
jgi:hypothetical protein